MGIYKFGNNTYPRPIRRRSNLGHIFREKSASYAPENTVHFFDKIIKSETEIHLTHGEETSKSHSLKLYTVVSREEQDMLESETRVP